MANNRLYIRDRETGEMTTALDVPRCGMCGARLRPMWPGAVSLICAACRDALVARGVYSRAVVEAMILRARQIKLGRWVTAAFGGRA